MIRLACLSLLCLAGLRGPAAAQQLDLSHGGPVEVTAMDGIDWHQNEQIVVANGNARAVRGDVTVTADRLIARYRRKAGAPAVTPASGRAGPAPQTGDPDTGNNEIYRLEAQGNVHITTPTDHAEGDRAIYDIDQAVLLLTGRAMKLTTPQQVLTARDTMEYWSQRHMAVGRGDAVVTTNDGRRLAADILVGYTDPGTTTPTPPAAAAAPPAGRPATAKPPDDPIAASGKLKKIEAFGHVEVRTISDIIHGDRGVYVPDIGIARLAGNVRITRGQNQLNGTEAIVNLKTGISRLVSSGAGRVQGLVVPNDTQAGGQPGAIRAPAPRPTAPAAGPAAGSPPATQAP